MKGQTEVLGLLVIVILFIFILFLFIFWNVNKEPDNVIRESLESSSFLRAMMFYTPEGCDKQIREIVDGCNSGTMICGESCQDLLDREIENILDNGISKKYSFSLMSDSGFEFTDGTCSVGVVDSYKTRKFEAKIRLCS